MSNTPYVVVIIGPTAVGKTGLSIKLGQKFRTEILSFDSRQFYSELNIGVAKPTIDELAAVPHHFINSHSIHQNYNVGQFEQEALDFINDFFKKESILLLVGGSGLYLKAILEGFDNFPPISTSIRQTLSEEYATEGIIFLQKKLQSLDPTYYATVDQQNPQRLMRALEICLSSGQPYSSFLSKKKKQRPFKSIIIALDRPRPQLYERINQRVDLMMEAGLLAEVKSLLPYQSLNALQTVGYKEIFEHLNGEINLEKAIELIKRNSRRYAKRQLTWLRSLDQVHWSDPQDLPSIISLIASIRMR